MISRWSNKGKNNCTNYNYWCNKLEKNCLACDEYHEAEDTYPYGENSNCNR